MPWGQLLQKVHLGACRLPDRELKGLGVLARAGLYEQRQQAMVKPGTAPDAAGTINLLITSVVGVHVLSNKYVTKP